MVFVHKRFENKEFKFVPNKVRSKKPAVDDWTKTNNYDFDDEAITNHNGNIGVLLGKLVVFDCDEIEAEGLARKLPKTLVIGTSMKGDFRKKHFYFLLKEPLKRKVLEKDGKHIGEIQGQGQQCLIPPSIHPSGIKYDIIEDNPIAQIEDGFLIDIIHPYIKGWQSMDLKKATKGVKEGTRNEVAFRLAIHQHKLDIPKGDALEWLKNWNNSNKPVLPESELITAIDSAYRYDTKKDNRKKKQKTSVIAAEIGRKILEKRIFKTARDTEDIYYYNDGIYHSGGEGLIKEMAGLIHGDDLNKNIYNEVIFFIQREARFDREEFNQDKNLLHLQNGIYNIEKKLLLPHSPESMSTTRIPIKYEPSADCPKIKKFFSEIVKEDDLPVLQEILGYCLYRDYPIQVAFMFVGGGANGKSTFLKVLMEMLGKDNYASVSLQDLEMRRFSSSNLFGKLANVYADLTDKALYSTGTFKMLTGGDSIIAEQKFKNSFTFFNHAKLLFSCNKLPEVRDDTPAFFRRWVILVFPNTFEGDKADPNLFLKLITAEEMSGLFNYAVIGLKRLLENGRFSHTVTTEETQEKYERMSNSFLAFIKDCIITDPDNYIPKEEFYKTYVSYCHSYNLPAKAKATISKEINQHLPSVSSARPTIEGKKTHAWRGVKISVDQLVQEDRLFPFLSLYSSSTLPKQTRYTKQSCFEEKEKEVKTSNLKEGKKGSLTGPVGPPKKTLSDKIEEWKDSEHSRKTLSYEKAMKLFNISEEEIEKLKLEGVIFEPTPGHIAFP